MFRLPTILSAERTQRSDLLLCTIAIVCMLGVWLIPVFISTNTVVDSTRYWWLCDDAMISMRYAHNLSEGNGLVWNTGQRVEGFTNPLWTGVMAVVHLFGANTANAPLVMLILTMASALLGIFGIRHLVDALEGGRMALTVSLMLYILNADILAWTTTGAESVPLMSVVVLALARGIREARTGKVGISTVSLSSLPALIRSDGIILTLLIWLIIIILHPSRSRALLQSCLALLPCIGYEIFRLLYYGNPLPNTAYLKAFGWNGKFMFGLRYIVQFAQWYAPFLVMAAAGVWRVRQRGISAAALLILLYTPYMLFTGGDTFRNLRFFVPIIPILLVLASVTLERIALQTTNWKPASGAVIAVVCIVLSALRFGPHFIEFLAPSREDEDSIRIGVYIRDHTPASWTVADTWAGTVLYISGHPGVDLLGKCDTVIARMSAVPTAPNASPGHNKFNYDYSLGILQPRILVAPFSYPVNNRELTSMTTGNLAFIGQLYTNGVFREHYLPYPIRSGYTRTIFVRDSLSAQLR